MKSTNSIGIESYLEVEERDQKKLKHHTLKRLLSFIFRHNKSLVLGFLMIFVGTFCALLEPRIFGYAIDEAIVPKRWDRLRAVSLLFFAVTSIRVFSAIQQAYLFELLGQKVTQDLRVLLFSHLQRMPVVVFDRNPAGRLLTRVTNDVAALNEMFSAGFVSMICNSLLVLGILIGLCVLDLRLGLIASSVFPFLVLISAYFSKKLTISYRDARAKLSALNSFLAENLSGMKIVNLFNRQKLHMSRFNRLNHGYADAQVGSVRIFALFQPTITIASGISMGLVVWYGGLETLNGSIKLGVLVAYFSYVLSLFQPVREIADKWNIFLSGMASAERIFSILDWPTEYSEQAVLADVQPLEHLRGHIVFENVWFAYQGESWVLKDFSFEIKSGEKIGIVGHTGAGKTTLVSLLMRFYEPQKGRILLDGKELSFYDKRSLRASIGIIQQEVFLFSGTFEENISFWKETPRDKLEEIFSKMNIQGDKFKLAKESEFQERGSNFSMGERQVIAFARAMAAEPKVWILDEATSNMDSSTEEMIQTSLQSVSFQRTSILIAHRLATVKDADCILVLHKGQLVEKGKHSELIGQNGLYAKLYRYQNSLN